MSLSEAFFSFSEERCFCLGNIIQYKANDHFEPICIAPNTAGTFGRSQSLSRTRSIHTEPNLSSGKGFFSHLFGGTRKERGVFPQLPDHCLPTPPIYIYAFTSNSALPFEAVRCALKLWRFPFVSKTLTETA